jgi:hypothetical protein
MIHLITTIASIPLLLAAPSSFHASLRASSAAACHAPQDARTKGEAAQAAPAPKIPDATFVDEEPADAKCVAEVKKAAKKGERVVVKAKVGGRSEPFVKNRAMLVVADRCMKSCDQIPGDTCAKPWDYCCEPPESLKANTMTVQFVGADGKVLKTGAQGVHGLEPLALVVIVGKVVERDDKGTFVVQAEKVFVEKDDAETDGKAEVAKDSKASKGSKDSKDSKDSKEGPAPTGTPKSNEQQSNE